MKKKNDIKKIWLSIGSVALATLPITSVISCSSGGAGNNDNSSSDNGNNNGSGSGGSTDNKPTVEQKYLSHSNRFEDLDSYARKTDVLLNFDQAKKDILNNKIKWFNEDGSAVKYQVKITLEPGIVATTRMWSDVDLEAPFDTTLNEYGKPINWYKKINEQVETIYQFWKKENNQSYTLKDFEIKSITEDVLNVGDGPGYAYVSLPLDKNIAVVDVINEDIDDYWRGCCLGFFIRGEEIEFCYRFFGRSDWQNIDKSKFSPIDLANNNLVVNGLKDSTLKSNVRELDYKFASGNVTISKVE